QASGPQGGGTDGDVEAAVVDSLTDEVVRQAQQLAVGTSGGGHRQTAIGAEESSGSRHEWWDFLENAAQVFGRSVELREVEEADVRRGYDAQGYYWGGNTIQKEVYMGYRRRMYPRHQDVEHSVRQVRRLGKCVDVARPAFYGFRYAVVGDRFQSQVSHPRHRDMLWATSNYDVFYANQGDVYCWNPWQSMARRSVLDRAQMPSQFKVRSMCADAGLVFVGDNRGRYCVKSLQTDAVAAGDSLGALCEDAVNHASPGVTRSGAAVIACAHASGAVRCLNVARLDVTETCVSGWCANSSSLAHNGTLQCVVGDSTEALLIDPRCGATSDPIARLTGHLGYLLSCSLSPDGNLVATASQDTSIRVYDVRRPQQSLATLCGYMGAMCAVRFSRCGNFLLGMETADYVHVYDARSFERSQSIGFMGESAGAAFSPDSNCLFLAVADSIHGSSLAEYTLEASF
ncbi:hypothetical protein EV175_004720, partial [Coemansia sp. RSA 1933]